MHITPSFRHHFIGLSLLLFALTTKANIQLRDLSKQLNNSNDTIGNEYYTIADPDEYRPQFFTPMSALKTLGAIADSDWNTNGQVPQEQNLLKWIFHSEPDSETPEKYQRKIHFGGWIRDPSKKTCLNVRGLVLKRDAVGDITYADEKECRITNSVWIDPYTNTEMTSADEVQIDHMVALKNAYISGAWQWNGSQRCTYANFIGNNFHLLSVLGTENNKKSDSSPEKYIPPSKEYICKYLVEWLKVKSIWKLKLAKNEALAISRELNANNCSSNDFQMEWSELDSQRELTTEFPSACENFNSANRKTN